MASTERFCISKDHFNQMKDSLCAKTCSPEHSKNTRRPSAMFFRWQQSSSKGRDVTRVSQKKKKKTRLTSFQIVSMEKGKVRELTLLKQLFFIHFRSLYSSEKYYEWDILITQWELKKVNFSRYIRSLLVMRLIFDWLFVFELTWSSYGDLYKQ